MVSSPSKAPAVIVLASQIVLIMGAVNDCESMNLGVLAPTADNVPPVGTKNAYINASTASRNQLMHWSTVDRVAYAIGYKNLTLVQAKKCDSGMRLEP